MNALVGNFLNIFVSEWIANNIDMNFRAWEIIAKEKIALWKNVRVDDWTAKGTIIASNVLFA